MIKIAPSILSADFANLERDIRRVSSADWLHVDVMDGCFVPNLTIGVPVVQSIRKCTGMFLDVHLMIEEPIRYIEEFKKAGADLLTVHLEACKDVKATLDAIHEAGMKVGLSICPETPAEEVEPYLEKVDMILVMSVHPGFGGQKFIPDTLEKIQAIRKMAKDQKRKIDIQVDGGIYLTNVKEVLDAGANIIVAGSAVFKGNAAENTREFMEILKSYE